MEKKARLVGRCRGAGDEVRGQRSYRSCEAEGITSLVGVVKWEEVGVSGGKRKSGKCNGGDVCFRREGREGQEGQEGQERGVSLLG